MSELTQEIKEKAVGCLSCPVCKRARKKQKGLAYWFVKVVEKGRCPQCAAYVKVFGKEAHEAITEEEINATLKKLGIERA